MSKHHWTSQKIITVRESIDGTKLTRIVHYIIKDRTMGFSRRDIGKRGKYSSLSEKNAAEMMARKRKRKIKEDASRVGVGTIDKKPKTKTPTANTVTALRNRGGNQNPKGELSAGAQASRKQNQGKENPFGTKARDRFRKKAKDQTEKNIQSGKDAAERQRNFFSRLFRRRGSQNPRGMNAGGLVKKSKGIDGVALRGKTRVKRTRG